MRHIDIGDLIYLDGSCDSSSLLPCGLISSTGPPTTTLVAVLLALAL